jgi:hypothetical protein
MAADDTAQRGQQRGAVRSSAGGWISVGVGPAALGDLLLWLLITLRSEGNSVKQPGAAQAVQGLVLMLWRGQHRRRRGELGAVSRGAEKGNVTEDHTLLHISSSGIACLSAHCTATLKELDTRRSCSSGL